MQIKAAKPNWLYIAIAVVLVATVSFTVWHFALDNNSKKYPEVVNNSTDDPDESPIGDDYNWQGKDTDPKYIELKSINAGGFIQKVAVDQRKEVGVPSNVHLAGYFTSSSIPGAKGLSIIDGHVDGRSKPGIFKNLDKLKKGAIFTIEYGNGKTKKFKVTSTTLINKEKAPPVLFSQDPTVTSQLNLITCGGTYDRKVRHYQDRIIVTSVPVS